MNSRTYSRTSRRHRRRLSSAQPANKLDPSKTLWPVSTLEAVFLPEFPIKGEVDESHFHVEGLIARGAFGKVIKVTKKDSGTVLAMKVMSKSHIISQNAVQQCKDEVSIQSSCGHHPFVVKCQYFWQNRKCLFLVTDYVPYGELLILWKKHTCLPEAIVRVYIGELALALDFLHNFGIIYRDLKMENILMDKAGHIQLIDFGLGKWLQIGTRTQTICGTIQYMAPEILRMEPYSHSADWWSLGIIMYSLLMGHYPVQGPTMHTKMEELVNRFDYSLSNNCSLHARNLCRKLLCKDPHKRLQSMRNLRWEPFFADFNFDMALNKEISPNQILEESLAKKALLEKISQIADDNATTENGVDLITMFEDFNWTDQADDV